MAPLSILQKLYIPFGIIDALLGAVWIAIAAPFRGKDTFASYSRHVKLAITRKALASLSPEQLQAVAGTAETNYLAWAKSNKQTTRVVELVSSKSKAFWIGETEAANLCIFYHGGGFAMPPSDGHFTHCLSLVESAKKAGKSIAVLFLQYDLAPGARYPRQLTQAVELLQYAVDDLAKPPSNIMLHGDSSGANLILGVLSHLMHPNPAIAPLKLQTPLKTAALSSPVTVLNTDNPRFVTQEKFDPGSAATIRIWLLNLLGPSSPDSWNEPLRNDSDWWSDLGKFIDSLLITVASKEMMAEDTINCFNKIKSVFEEATLFESDVDFHAEPSIGPSLGMAEGEAARKMIEYSLDRI